MAAATVKPPGPTMQPSPQRDRPAPAPRESRKRDGKLALWLRIVISVVIVWHFTAIFLAALCIPASSRLVVDIAQKPPMQWYLDALYLNQGHSFFAPDVGPSRVVRYELFDQSGRPVTSGQLPSRNDHWPRLRYHRHFMLADQAPSDDPKWGRAHLEAYARQLLRANPDAQAVRVRQYAHWPLTQDLETRARAEGYDRAYQVFVQQMSENGVTIDDHGMQMLMEVMQRRSDLGPDTNTQSNAWQSERLDMADRWQGGPR
jgi:hypothetical protein